MYEILRTDDPRFPGPCEECKKTVDKGPYVYFQGLRGIWHAECWYRSERSKSAAEAMQPEIPDDIKFAVENMSHELAALRIKVDQTFSFVDMIYKQLPPKVV